jgi:two-component system, cell cycle sensor histidine kinase and response regulator CckA
MSKELYILILEDRPADAELVIYELRKTGLPFVEKCVASEADFLAELRHSRPDLILADYSLPSYDGLSALAAARTEAPGVPFIFVSGTMGEEIAIEALHHGATDYVLKQRLTRLGPAVQRALREIELRSQRQQAEAALRASEQNYRQICNASSDAIFVHDAANGAVLDVNQSALEMYGYSREELMSLPGERLLVGGAFSHAEALRRIRQATAEGPQRFEWQSKSKNGERFWTEVVLRSAEIGGQDRVLAVVRDITERRQTDEALRISEERFRSVWEHSSDGMRLTDGGGRILAVNEAFCRLVQLPREKLIGEVFSVAYAEHGPDEGLEVYRERFDTGTIPPRLATHLRLWNSEELDVDISSSIIESGRGGKTLLSIFRDITEHRRAELREAAFSNLGQRLSAAKTAREAAEIIVDVADRLLGWDACTLDLYSAEKDRVSHVLNLDTINGHRVECPGVYHDEPPSPRMRRVLEAGGQLILRDPAGGLAPDAKSFGDIARPSASAVFVPIRDGSIVIGACSIHSYRPNAYDQRSLETLQMLADHCAGALKRISAQEALSASEANYRGLVERSPDAIFLHRDEKFVYANPAAMKLLRAEAPRDIIGRSVLDLVRPENRDVIRRRIQEAVEGGRPPLMEQKVLRLDGTPFEAEATSIPLTYEGQPAVQTIMRDITGRKELEQQLRQSQKMEAVGQLAGGVAHDFNNMLAVIRGNAELLLLDPDQLTAEASGCLKQVVAATERAANLTRQLLAFSRKQMMQTQPLALNDVIGDLTKMLNRVIREDIRLQCNYAPRLPFIQADRGMMEQVLLNLVVNARDAMPRGGQLLITTDTARFDETYARGHPEASAGEYVCLTVSDTGIGIAPEHLPRIFEPFFTTKELGKGTGLGLATVYGIVKQHLGWIEVSSQPAAGSTFKVFLPAAAAPSGSEAAPQAEAAVRGGTEAILLVEDDYAVRVITRRVLESQGYKVYEATSVPQALELWRSRAGEIALLLSDIVMPEGVTGRELAEQLRVHRPTLKVILMSGYSADVAGKDTDFFQRRETIFLQKPCSSRTLLESVRRCLDAN